jgi:signal transduction histidine kinase
VGVKFPVRSAAADPRVQDTALALALTAADLAVTLYYRHQLDPLGVAIALVAAENLPLMFRRAHPLIVLTIIGGARVAYDVIGLGYAPLPLGPAIAFYTVMNRCRPRAWVFSCVLALVAITISQLQPGHNEPYDVVVALLIFVAAGMAGLLSRTRRAYLEEAEARAARAEAQRDRESARAAAGERARIARELHDVVAHHVSLMAVQAEAAASLLPDRPAQARQSVEIIGDTARQALAELRRLLGVLRGPAEEIETEPSPSLSELGAVLDQVRAAGLPVEFRTGGQPAALAPGVELTAYRIVQEALTNTLKHAPASQAVVTLAYEPDFVTVTVANSAPPAATLAAVPAAAATQSLATAPPPAPASAPPAPVRLPAAPGPVPAAPSRAPALSAPSPPVAEMSSAVTRLLAVAGVRPAAVRPAAAREGTATRSGFGLAGIAERVASCGGNLSAGPAPDGGFAVTARLPAR